jgi:hypothetical protein
MPRISINFFVPSGSAVLDTNSAPVSVPASPDALTLMAHLRPVKEGRSLGAIRRGTACCARPLSKAESSRCKAKCAGTPVKAGGATPSIEVPGTATKPGCSIIPSVTMDRSSPPALNFRYICVAPSENPVVAALVSSYFHEPDTYSAVLVVPDVSVALLGNERLWRRWLYRSSDSAGVLQ